MTIFCINGAQGSNMKLTGPKLETKRVKKEGVDGMMGLGEAPGHRRMSCNNRGYNRPNNEIYVID